MTGGQRSIVRGLRAIGYGAVTSVAVAVALSGTGSDLKVSPANIDALQSPAEAIVAQHDCSVYGYGPDGPIPGHAVVDTGTGPRYSRSQVAFDIWEGKLDGTIHAWCL